MLKTSVVFQRIRVTELFLTRELFRGVHNEPLECVRLYLLSRILFINPDRARRAPDLGLRECNTL